MIDKNQMISVFSQYLANTKQRVEFNGAEYLLLTEENEVTIRTGTEYEMYFYIVGFIGAANTYAKEIGALHEEIEEYKKIISSLKKVEPSQN